jgi:hypothetical protein
MNAAGLIIDMPDERRRVGITRAEADRVVGCWNYAQAWRRPGDRYDIPGPPREREYEGIL